MKYSLKQTFFMTAILAAGGASLLLFTRCVTEGSATDSQAVLNALPDQVVLPAYEGFTAASILLQDRVTELCGSPSPDSLAAARQAWGAAQRALKESEVLSFGPYKDLNIGRQVDFWPTRPNNIEGAIEDNDDFGADFLENMSVSAKGLPAMEYLLFTPASANDNLAGLSADSGKRCRFLEALASDLNAQSNRLYSSWSPLEGDFSASLSAPGTDVSPFPNIQNALSVLVNQMVFTVELVKDTKLGKPLGKASGGDPQPSLVESPYSGRSVDGMIANLRGLTRFYNGSFDGAPAPDSLHALVAERDLFVADYVNQLIADAIRELEGISGPFADSLETDTARAEAAYEKLRLLKAQLAGPVSGRLGVTPFFNDNDGD